MSVSIRKKWIEIEAPGLDLFLFVALPDGRPETWQHVANVRYLAGPQGGFWIVEAPRERVYDQLERIGAPCNSHQEARLVAEELVNQALWRHGLPRLEC